VPTLAQPARQRRRRDSAAGNSRGPERRRRCLVVGRLKLRSTEGRRDARLRHLAGHLQRGAAPRPRTATLAGRQPSTPRGDIAVLLDPRRVPPPRFTPAASATARCEFEIPSGRGGPLRAMSWFRHAAIRRSPASPPPRKVPGRWRVSAVVVCSLHIHALQRLGTVSAHRSAMAALGSGRGVASNRAIQR
jgi:hypothetical protein